MELKKNVNCDKVGKFLCALCPRTEFASSYSPTEIYFEIFKVKFKVKTSYSNNFIDIVK